VHGYALSQDWLVASLYHDPCMPCACPVKLVAVLDSMESEEELVYRRRRSVQEQRYQQWQQERAHEQDPRYEWMREPFHLWITNP
jgi:hypothetical protein